MADFAPLLNDTNYFDWRMRIAARANLEGVDQFLSGPVREPSESYLQEEHRRLEQKATSLVTLSVEPTMAGKFGYDWEAKKPFLQMLMIQRYFKTFDTPWNHEVLRKKAQHLSIKLHETLDKYVDRHIGLRAQMRVAKCPGIENEQVTVIYILNGLRSSQYRAIYKRLVPTIIPRTVLECLNTLQALDSAMDNNERRAHRLKKWCDWHQHNGWHSTEECRALKEARDRRGGRSRPRKRRAISDPEHPRKAMKMET